MQSEIVKQSRIKFRVNVISESVFFPMDTGGVHTAFLNHKNLLGKEKISFLVNSLGKAEITHIHTIGPFALYKLLTSKNIVMPSHHLPQSYIGSYRGGKIFQGVIKKYLRFFYNRADLVIALNSSTEAELRKIGVKTTIKLLPNPVNLDKFKSDIFLKEKERKNYNIKKNEFVIISAGYLIQRKGVIEFVDLAKYFLDIYFIWVGGKSFNFLNMETAEQKRALDSPPKNLIITGQVSYDRMPGLYNAADMLLFPSHQETQGMVIVEAAACGLPLVLRDLPEYKALYDDSYIACRDNNEFIAAIKSLTSDKELYIKYRDKSLILSQKFADNIIAENMVKFYKSLLSSD